MKILSFGVNFLVKSGTRCALFIWYVPVIMLCLIDVINVIVTTFCITPITTCFPVYPLGQVFSVTLYSSQELFRESCTVFRLLSKLPPRLLLHVYTPLLCPLCFRPFRLLHLRDSEYLLQ